ncbi:helix-turn-helix domain-containing protein [Methanococcus maripaludis]|uniref:DNA-binding HxlR family transcriptional regulator n=2 Tax=Methanococcus maripaludis TaxID=39152 RepID=A0A7J9NZK4_METMI|nr:winged helix-turn-helix transcriptional regulator [Methanococcus maripaludis]MBA2852664.1 DNA-binding HxlR family transcriptional regulator [Methanococcus maripaludis]MBA2861612.1 DNA-binding HxlR family transcriptional regulator [Methanococcus maripaludis]
MLTKLLGKKYAVETLQFLENGEKYFGEIKDSLETHKSSLSLLMKELEDADLISRREEPYRNMNKVYFKLTENGITVLKYVNLINNLGNENTAKNNQDIHIKNNHGIIANNIQNLNVKK